VEARHQVPRKSTLEAELACEPRQRSASCIAGSSELAPGCAVILPGVGGTHELNWACLLSTQGGTAEHPLRP